MGNTIEFANDIGDMCHNTLFKEERINIDYDKIYEIHDIQLLLNVHWSKLTDQLRREWTRPLKVYICRDFCEDDAVDDEHRTEINEDYLLSHGKYQYYVAEIRVKHCDLNTVIEENNYLTVNIVKYHMQHNDWKHYEILDYRPHMPYNEIKKLRTPTKHLLQHVYRETPRQLCELLSHMKKLTHASIDEYICEHNIFLLSDLNELNKMYKNIYVWDELTTLPINVH